MSLQYRKFLWANLSAALIIAIVGGMLFGLLIPRFFSTMMPVLLLSALIINLITFGILLPKKDRKINLMLSITKSFAIKFFSYIALVVLILLFHEAKEVIVSLVVFLFLLYIIFSFIEVRAFSKMARQV